ncbi:MAG: hypothetical protein IKS11_09630 [Lachnospiraceae bacterium]|jgi:hypothetical protein|nr:hypothetical protein [Lachnospiraceae bacterium]
MKEENVLCATNAYKELYYFNKRFGKLPENVKKELQIALVSFTTEVGGVVTLYFEEDGTLMINTDHEENDFLYDDISAGLLTRRLQREKEELFEQLELFYRTFYMKDETDKD